MARSTIRVALMATALVGAGLAVTPVGAETLAELDALSDASADEAGGIQTARDQAARGQYLDALATLERVLAQHPKSAEAQLIHAIFLCQIDDRRGGLVEMDRLKKKNYTKELLADSRALCAPKAGS